MKYVKTFENFTYSPINEEEEIFKKIGQLFTGLVSRVKAKFQSWKDAKKKAAAEKIAKLLEENKNNPKVMEIIQKIQAEYAKCSDADKKQLAELQTNENKINVLGDKLNKSGIGNSTETTGAKTGEQLTEHAIYESLILESNRKELIGRIVTYAAVGVAVATIIFWGWAMATAVGGYVAVTALVGGGMAAGHFSAIVVAVLVACGIIGGTADSMT